MKDNLNNKIQRVKKTNKHKKLFHKILLGLASIMVLVTAYSLMLPAITAKKADVNSMDDVVMVSEITRDIESEEGGQSEDNSAGDEGANESGTENDGVDSSNDSGGNESQNEASATESEEASIDNASKDTEDTSKNDDKDNKDKAENASPDLNGKNETIEEDGVPTGNGENEKAEDSKNEEAKSGGEVKEEEKDSKKEDGNNKDVKSSEESENSKEDATDKKQTSTDKNEEKSDDKDSENSNDKKEKDTGSNDAKTEENSKIENKDEKSEEEPKEDSKTGENESKENKETEDKETENKDKKNEKDAKEESENGKTELDLAKEQIKAIDEKLAVDTLSEDEKNKLNQEKEALAAKIANFEQEEQKEKEAEPFVADGKTPLTAEEIAKISEEDFARLEASRELEISLNPAVQNGSQPAQMNQRGANGVAFTKGKARITLPLGVSSENVEGYLQSLDTMYLYEVEENDSSGAKTKVIYKTVTAYDIQLFDKESGEPIHQFLDSDGKARKIGIRFYDVSIKADDSFFYELNYVSDGAPDVLKDEYREKMEILGLIDTDMTAENGEAYGQLDFETLHLSKYVLFKGEADAMAEINPGEAIDIFTFKKLVEDNNTNHPGTPLSLVNTVVIKSGEAYELENDVVRGDINGSPFQGELFRIEQGGDLSVRARISGEHKGAYAPLIVNNKGSLFIDENATLENNMNMGPYADRSSEYPYRARGGAVFSSGEVVLNGGSIQSCEAQIGGGIYIDGDGSDTDFTMNYGNVQFNKAKHYDTSWYNTSSSSPEQYRCAGGGIYIGNNVRASIHDGSINNNISDRDGGGISLRDTALNSSIEGYNLVSTISVLGGQIDSNTAEMSGGGLFIGNNTEGIIRGGFFTNNEAKGIDTLSGKTDVYSGGGIYVDHSVNGRVGSLDIKNVLISNNSSVAEGGGYVACPTADTNMFAFEGALFFNNSEGSGLNDFHDVAINDSKGLPSNVENEMLGGYMLVFDDDNTDHFYRARAEVSQDDVNSVVNQGLVYVRITNNRGFRGGGIAVNGSINIGTKQDQDGCSAYTTVSVLKKWGNDDEANRPSSIKVQLFKNGKICDEVILDQGNNWYHEWNKLPNEDYSIKEVEVNPGDLDGYTSKITMENGISKKVHAFKDGLDYVILYRDRPLLNEKNLKEEDIRFYKDLSYEDPINKMRWTASTLNGNFKLNNRATGRPLGFDDNFSGVFAKVSGVESFEFNYHYYEEKDLGFLYAAYSGNNYYASMPGDVDPMTNYSYYIPVASDSNPCSCASEIEIRQVVDKAFTISNTQYESEAKIVLNKVDANSKKGLEGATFILYKEDSSGVVVSGEHRGKMVGEIITNSEGIVIMDDIIPQGVYYLKETKAPGNHTILNKPLVFKVDKNGKFVDLSTGDYPTNEFIHVSTDDGDDVIAYRHYAGETTNLFVKNRLVGIVLPETGGMGTGLFTLVGTVLMAGSAAVIITRRYKKRRA